MRRPCMVLFVVRPFDITPILVKYVETYVEMLIQKYFSVVFDFYQAATKKYPNFGGNFKPWSFAGFIT